MQENAFFKGHKILNYGKGQSLKNFTLIFYTIIKVLLKFPPPLQILKTFTTWNFSSLSITKMNPDATCISMLLPYFVLRRYRRWRLHCRVTKCSGAKNTLELLRKLKMGRKSLIEIEWKFSIMIIEILAGI